MGGKPPQTPPLIAGAERSFFLPPKARFARLGINLISVLHLDSNVHICVWHLKCYSSSPLYVPLTPYLHNLGLPSASHLSRMLNINCHLLIIVDDEDEAIRMSLILILNDKDEGDKQ